MFTNTSLLFGGKQFCCLSRNLSPFKGNPSQMMEWKVNLSEAPAERLGVSNTTLPQCLGQNRSIVCGIVTT